MLKRISPYAHSLKQACIPALLMLPTLAVAQNPLGGAEEITDLPEAVSPYVIPATNGPRFFQVTD